MSNILVEAKAKVNPYKVGKIAVVVVLYGLLYGFTALFWFLAWTNGESAWIVPATLFFFGSCVFTGVGGYNLYLSFKEKEARWRPYDETPASVRSDRSLRAARGPLDPDHWDD